eukprot:TRINITY_DN7936_c0_g1_i1.p1 TRINITY_DN7936_c0_g1~~TRINITY_DN7936_c0_g1_i1.p1  ORF type:complete len:868 (+),score=190.93 TRINITY_DN7936_c0_g1_i1:7-2610(+)
MSKVGACSMDRELSRDGLSSSHGFSTSQMGGASPRRNQAWNEVLEICKKGFGNKLGSMGDEILQKVRVELQQNAVAVRQDVKNMFVQHSSQEDLKFSELSRSIQKITEVAECSLLSSVGGGSNVDIGPMLDEFRTNEINRSEVDRRFHQQIKEEVANVNDNFQKLTKRTELGEDRVRQLASRMLDLETHLVSVSDAQSALFSKSDKLAEEIRKADVERQHQGDQLAEKLDDLLKQQPGAGEQQRVVKEVWGVTSAVTKNCNGILNEIGKIQKALHLDFVQRQEEAEAEEQMKAFERMNLSIPEFIHTFRTNDQFVTKVSLTTGIPEFELTQFGDEELQRWFVEMDSDGSGTLDFKEFIDGIRAIIKKKTKSSGQKRVREIWTQTEAVEGSSKWTQTDARMTAERKVKRSATVLGSNGSSKKSMREDEPSAKAFADADVLKKKARAALISKPAYNVAAFYKDKGFCQWIARSQYFEYVTLLVVCLNAVWLAIDIDTNPAPFITDAEMGYVLAENLFCTYFFVELCVRFASFERKVQCLQDFWFAFDLLLIVLMVSETWLAPIVITAAKIDVTSGGIVDISFVKLLKLVKIMRLSRLAKLLRTVPELVIIMKGIGFAARSVFVFVLFWMVVIYMFAILLTELTRDLDIGADRFPTVTKSMNTLLLAGVIPDQTGLVNEMGDSVWYLWPIIVCFVLLCSLTIMYMLVGVLVDVVGMIASSEKEAMTVQYVASSLRELMEELGYELDAGIPRDEFTKLLLEPEVTRVIAGIGADVIVLVDMLDIIYEDVARNGGDGLNFQDLVEIVLNMRGANPATVKDVKEQLRVTKQMLNATGDKLMRKMSGEFRYVLAEFQAVKEELRSKRDADDLDD